MGNAITILVNKIQPLLHVLILHFVRRVVELQYLRHRLLPIEIIKGLTDKGQFQYLTKLMGPQEGTYLYTTQFHSIR